ncbi:transposase [Pseudomonas putida CSV86]|uniref:Transposase n=1 Tax=Pseudomonas bharatica CSV86 TaxID=1005395 RepID=L1M5D3_9PSED|nr:transposase [Pseudomonas bharatica]NNJ18082.1 transposase [Pseudomonas bharatica CSV86]
MDRPSSNRLRRGRVSEPGRLYVLTTATELRAPIFNDFGLARLVIHQLRQTEQEGSVTSLAWVVMPDHLHWLIELKSVTLKTLMRRFKSRSTCAVNKACGRQGKLWQQGFHDRALRREDDIVAVARYIVANPIRAGLVRKAADYSHWDAVWL